MRRRGSTCVLTGFFDHATLTADQDELDPEPTEHSQEPAGEPPQDARCAQSELGQRLLSGDTAQLSLAMAQAGRDANVSAIALFTQKGLFARRVMDNMGLADLNAEISSLEAEDDLSAVQLAQALRRAREGLRTQVRDFVEREFLLHADHDGRRLREELLKRVKLSNIDRRNFKHLKTIVMRMAKRLETMATRKRKVFRRGHLHVPRTLRSNMSYDGALFDLRWKSKKIGKPKIFAICDVSGSVANYAPLHAHVSLQPRSGCSSCARLCFFFSSRRSHGMVRGDRFSNLQLTAPCTSMGGGSTDYGRALADLHDLCLNEIDHRATIIMLGDARNNYGDPCQELLQTLYERAGRIIWLNPEPRGNWVVGDAEMRAYLPYCHQARVCNSLEHLERLMSDLVKMAR